MKHAFGILLLLLCVLPFHVVAQDVAAQGSSLANVPAGNYTLDKSHGSLIFRVNHMGFSMYTARFVKFDVSLDFDPAAPEASQVEASVDVTSLETDFPHPEIIDFNAELLGEKWLDAKNFPAMTYRASGVTMTGADTGTVKGELNLHGVTRPVVLSVKFNGGYPGMAMDPRARIGFSVHAALKRSDFGIDLGIPAPGSNMGVSDAVEIIIETELNGPAWPGAAE